MPCRLEKTPAQQEDCSDCDPCQATGTCPFSLKCEHADNALHCASHRGTAPCEEPGFTWTPPKYRIAVTGLVLALLVLPGCFTLSDINTGVSAGRTFEDGQVFTTGKTLWNVSVSGHWVREKR